MLAIVGGSRNSSLGIEATSVSPWSVAKRTEALSGGVAQGASLARAQVNDSDLLILDELLGKLDGLTRVIMQGELTRLWQRCGGEYFPNAAGKKKRPEGRLSRS